MPTRTQVIATTVLKQVPTGLTLVALALLAWWGHAHDWTIPKRSALVARLLGRPEAEDGKDDKPKEAEAPADGKALRTVTLDSAEAADKAGFDFAKVEEWPMGEYVSAFGEVAYDPLRIAHLAPRAAGTIWSVEKQTGDPVKKGDVLAVIAAAEVARLKTDLQQALLQVEVRNRSLRMLQGISSTPERQFREAEMLLREARLRLSGDQQALLNLGLPLRLDDLAGLPDEEVGRRLARLGLPDALVRKGAEGALPANLLPMYAPFDGLVVRHEAVLGEVVTTTQPQFTVADVSHLMVLLNLRVEDVNRVALGQEVFFRPDGSAYEARGPLRWVSAEADEKTRTVRARATLPNPDGRLRPHTFGTGRVLVRPIPHAVAVPDAAVQWEGKKPLVFVRRSPTEFVPREVKLGVKQDGRTQVLAGVRPGEEVVTTGSHVLHSEMVKDRIEGDD